MTRRERQAGEDMYELMKRLFLYAEVSPGKE